MDAQVLRAQQWLNQNYGDNPLFSGIDEDGITGSFMFLSLIHIYNDDFYQERGNRLKMGHRDLLEHLRDKDRRYYYDHVLVPMPNTTLKDFI